ncbi:MAG: hypothetical protein RML40_10930 [Bacteroidota bacterium]|nr:hypothetical protein [Candidatus Kapabacteria bacterium]MDW8221028.1 hypothetical protein [Bacteroidota bacterium]
MVYRLASTLLAERTPRSSPLSLTTPPSALGLSQILFVYSSCRRFPLILRYGRDLAGSYRGKVLAKALVAWFFILNYVVSLVRGQTS